MMTHSPEEQTRFYNARRPICLYPLDENNLNDHIISSRTSAVFPTRQPRKRKHFECESAQLVPTETTSSICNNYNITQAELEDINTCSQLNKKARYDDTTTVWSDGNDTLLTRVNNTTDAQSLIDDTGLGRGELLTFDLRDVT
eukprot:TRINITY_DN2874_c0_g1_i1.p1 TRINITY_DN2874_c0_g1~~TRINITY_DN2874_c0_g1_i1.p1  ORF type:complete len:143 (-),score=28.16 TRINITY_DN2874_c0_g1_i1:115-543(-)